MWLDSTILSVSADKAIMYFKLVLKNVPSPVKIPVSFAYNYGCKTFSPASYLPIADRAGGKEAFCHKMVNSEFGT